MTYNLSRAMNKPLHSRPRISTVERKRPSVVMCAGRTGVKPNELCREMQCGLFGARNDYTIATALSGFLVARVGLRPPCISQLVVGIHEMRLTHAVDGLCNAFAHGEIR